VSRDAAIQAGARLLVLLEGDRVVGDALVQLLEVLLREVLGAPNPRALGGYADGACERAMFYSKGPSFVIRL
jgi:hypothetical protein